MTAQTTTFLASAAWASANARAPSPYDWCTWEVVIRCRMPPDAEHQSARSRSARMPFCQASTREYVSLVEFMTEAMMVCRLSSGTLTQFIQRYTGHTPRDHRDILADHRVLFRDHKKIYHSMLKVFGDERLTTLMQCNEQALAAWVRENFSSVTPPMHLIA